MLLVLALSRKIFQFVIYLTRKYSVMKKLKFSSKILIFFWPSSGKEIRWDNLGSFYWLGLANSGGYAAN